MPDTFQESISIIENPTQNFESVKKLVKSKFSKMYTLRLTRSTKPLNYLMDKETNQLKDDSHQTIGYEFHTEVADASRVSLIGNLPAIIPPNIDKLWQDQRSVIILSYFFRKNYSLIYF